MNKLFFLFFIVGLISCNYKENVINEQAPIEFTNYLKKEFIKRKNGSLFFLDSLNNLSDIKPVLKSKVLSWKAYFLIKRKKYTEATESIKLLYEIAEGDDTILIDYYYLLGLIEEYKNNLYQSLYNYNRAAEVLERNKIPETTFYKADKFLLKIGSKNRDLNRNSYALKYSDSALKKHFDYSEPDALFLHNYYTLKAGVFSSTASFDKDSARFYFTAAEKLNLKNNLQSNNIFYAKAQYHFNLSELDSTVYYMSKVSKKYLDSSISDELNLLGVFSRQNKIDKAEIELKKINYYLNKGGLTSNDSLLYYDNIIEYNLAKKDITELKKVFIGYHEFRDRFNNQENQKNITELSSVLDLKQKDKDIIRVNDKLSKSLYQRNLIVFSVVVLFLVILILILFYRAKVVKKQLLFEKNAVDLKMKLLQSQINPHFIFNTLASIQSNIRQNKNEESIVYLNKFSKLMRDTLNISRAEKNTLHQELDVLQTYVDLQQLRKNNFDFEITLDEELVDLQYEVIVPMLSLQPFIENAILHGFKGIDYQGEITVDAFIDTDDNLVILVKDNGVGLPLVPKKSSGHTSHGLSIIREQFETLKKVHNKESSLTIHNRTDKSGVIVTLKTPIVIS